MRKNSLDTLIALRSVELRYTLWSLFADLIDPFLVTYNHEDGRLKEIPDPQELRVGCGAGSRRGAKVSQQHTVVILLQANQQYAVWCPMILLKWCRRAPSSEVFWTLW